MRSKKAQTVLPFFGLQLAGVIFFLIVLLTILLLAKNVRFTANEFDREIQDQGALRRLLTSTDCFAYEDVSMTLVNNNGQDQVLYGSRPNPGLVDYYKLNDFDYFNCMRKDRYDLISEAMRGAWDARVGSGASFKYLVSVYDLGTSSFIYSSTYPSDSKSSSYMGSAIARLDKNEKDCSTLLLTADSCGSAYGGSWKCVLSDFGCSDAENILGCEEGRCYLPVKGSIGQGSKFVPLWGFNNPPFSFGTVKTTTEFPNDFDYSCLSFDWQKIIDDSNCGKIRDVLRGYIANPGALLTEGFIKTGDNIATIMQSAGCMSRLNEPACMESYKAYIAKFHYDQFSEECLDGRTITMPIMIKKDGITSSGIFSMRSCVVQGSNYSFSTGFDATLDVNKETGCVGS